MPVRHDRSNLGAPSAWVSRLLRETVRFCTTVQFLFPIGKARILGGATIGRLAGLLRKGEGGGHSAVGLFRERNGEVQPDRGSETVVTELRMEHSAGSNSRDTALSPSNLAA